MNSLFRFSSACTLTLGLAMHLSCDETLPARDEPERVLITTATGANGTIVYRYGIFDGNGGALVMSVKNAYSEVLQADERIRGDVDVWLRDMPDKRAAVFADRTNLTDPTILRANVVTLEPGAAATMLKRWEPRITVGSDSGHFFWEYVDSTEKFTPLGEAYWESDPVRFVANARVQIFKNVQAVNVRHFEFTVVYLRYKDPGATRPS